ncbi:hypothetical protein PoB_001900900 [Plakobranchus ocellatus]|uniref:Uncharacterized protein n=1 Tax=Plakobranchus ocellatus TaxID=259542 RepID=A0AAV3ZAX8_9GAST|nr:hypothetical protein PoB_001900900 [Plakobranchus ocellatus]
MPSQFFIAHLRPPSTKWVARSLKIPAKVKAGRKAVINYLRLPHAKSYHVFTLGPPMLEQAWDSAYFIHSHGFVLVREQQNDIRLSDSRQAKKFVAGSG